MSWKMNDKEFQAVLLLPGKKRYEYFIKRVTDWEELWSLRDENGWVLMGDNEGNKLVPVWPHIRFAQANATGEWDGCSPKAIRLSMWLEYWIPGMLRDHRLVAVFPTPLNTGVVVSPERLRIDLEIELSLYE